jgi:hypothetical protein
LNISGDKSDSASSGKFKASRQFMEWATNFLESQPPADDKLHRKQLDRLTEDWFFHHIPNSWRFLSLKTCWEIDRLAVQMWKRKPGHGFLKALQSNCALAISKIYGKCAGVKSDHA